MENYSDYSDDDLKSVIIENIKVLGVDPELVDIKIEPGPVITISGEVSSEREKNRIIQTILDIVGIEEVVDELEVIGGKFSDFHSEDHEDEDEDPIDDDNESMGTEDLNRSMEDGLPYIPPTQSPFEEDRENKKRPKPRK
ncbi:MAG: BON domain-containing protein [Candidatus Omnitrophica bacterium]|nr:BON domain-containing protein [Candidatus Omnitrophota bacterium]